jgi:hypothetical protein
MRVRVTPSVKVWVLRVSVRFWSPSGRPVPSATALPVGMMLRVPATANKVAATAAMRDGRAEDVMLAILVGSVESFLR